MYMYYRLRAIRLRQAVFYFLICLILNMFFNNIQVDLLATHTSTSYYCLLRLISTNDTLLFNVKLSQIVIGKLQDNFYSVN